jgi:hypothetical protein
MGRENKYYVWEFGDLDLDDRPPPKLASLRGLEEVSFTSGNLISDRLPEVVFVVDPKRKLTDYQFNIPGFPLFSAALRKGLEEIGIDNIQYFEARLVAKRGKLIRDDYKIGNVIGRVACFDWERSSYDETYKAQGVVGRLERIVLDLSRIKGEQLFRLKEAPRVLLVAESTRLHLESRGITGVKFTEIADYEV